MNHVYTAGCSLHIHYKQAFESLIMHNYFSEGSLTTYRITEFENEYVVLVLSSFCANQPHVF